MEFVRDAVDRIHERIDQCLESQLAGVVVGHLPTSEHLCRIWYQLELPEDARDEWNLIIADLEKRPLRIVLVRNEEIPTNPAPPLMIKYANTS